MNHYKAYNGYVGESAIYVDVYACNEKDAMDEAVRLFKEEAEDTDYEYKVKRALDFGWDVKSVKRYRYEEDYWNHEQIEIYLCYEGLVCCKCKGEDQ